MVVDSQSKHDKSLFQDQERFWRTYFKYDAQHMLGMSPRREGEEIWQKYYDISDAREAENYRIFSQLNVAWLVLLSYSILGILFIFFPHVTSLPISWEYDLYSSLLAQFLKGIYIYTVLGSTSLLLILTPLLFKLHRSSINIHDKDCTLSDKARQYHAQECLLRGRYNGITASLSHEAQDSPIITDRFDVLQFNRAVEIYEEQEKLAEEHLKQCRHNLAAGTKSKHSKMQKEKAHDQKESTSTTDGMNEYLLSSQYYKKIKAQKKSEHEKAKTTSNITMKDTTAEQHAINTHQEIAGTQPIKLECEQTSKVEASIESPSK